MREGAYASYATANYYSNIIGVGPIYLQSRLLHRLSAGNHGKLDKAIHVLGFLWG